MPPLLAANAGNTALKLALFDPEGRLAWRLVCPNAELLELEARVRAGLADHPRPAALVSGSVRPATRPALDRLAGALGVSHEPVRRERIRVANRTREPEQVGLDRLLNARAALARAVCEWIVVDCGTAIVCDRVSPEGGGTFLGGAIAPGAGLAARALHEGTALLPFVPLEATEQALGQETRECLRAGVYWGFRGLVGKLVARLAEEAGRPARVAFTGGDGALLSAEVPGAEYLRDLTLEGVAAYHADLGGA